MSEFSALQQVGFLESREQYGVLVAIGSNSVKGILSPGPFTFVMTDAGDEVEVDQSVDLLTSDLATLGLSVAGLPASCTDRITITVDSVDCRLVAFNGETADPTTKLYLRIAR